CPAPLRLLLVSMMAVANEAGFLRASLSIVSLSLSLVVFAALAAFPADDDDTDIDDALGWFSHAFLAALPRTSLTSSAADFLVALPSSDDRLEDMIVSKVP